MKIYTSIPTAVIILAVLSAQPAWSAKLYKWVDKDGNISYQDSPPPDGSKLIEEQELKTTSSSEPSVVSPQPNNTPVIVYTVDNCESCELLLLRFQNWGINAQEHSLQNRDVQARILELTDSLSAPTLFLGDKLIPDLSAQNIISELEKVGYQVDNSSYVESTETESEN